MKSHLLTQRLAVERPVTLQGEMGTSSGTFRPYRGGKPVAAQRVKLSGRMMAENGEAFADYRAEYIVHYDHPVADHWRVTDMETGIAYTVTASLPDPGNSLRRLLCERVNE